MNILKYEILTPGQKIKRILKELNIKQQAIAYRNFSAGYISQIINDKEEINPSTAKYIAERIKELAAKSGVVYDITSEYILEDVYSQIENLTATIIIEITNSTDKNSIEKNISEIDLLVIKYSSYFNDSLLYKLYETIYKKLYDFKMYYECKTEVVRCIEIAIRNNMDITELILVMIRCNSLLNNYEDVITWGKTLKSVNIDNYTIKAINYNIANAYKELNKIDLCINHIKNIENKFNWSKGDRLRIKVLYAECLKLKKEINTAEKIYLKLLANIDEIEQTYIKVLIFANLSEIYLINNNLIKSLFFINKAITFQNEEYEYKDSIEQSVYYDAINVYALLHNTDLCNFYFKKIIEECKNNCNEKLVLKTFNIMAEYYIKNNEDNLLVELIDNLEKSIEHKYIFKSEALKIFILAANHFRNKDMEVFNDILNKQLNVIKLL